MVSRIVLFWTICGRLPNNMVMLCFVLSIFLCGINTVEAHTPHDDIFQIELSPNYDQDQTLYLICRSNLLKSTDGGYTWKRMIKGLDHKHRLYSLDISSLSKEVLFLSSLGDGIYKSKDGGNSWLKVNQGLETLSIDLVGISPNRDEFVLAAGTESGLYRTTNGGERWHQVIKNKKITAIAYSKNQVLVGDDKGNLYFSEDKGEKWNLLYHIKDGIKITVIDTHSDSDITFFLGTEKGDIFKTDDGGATINQLNVAISEQPITSLSMSPKYETDSIVFASTWYDGVLCSSNGGKSWKKCNTGLTSNHQADLLKRPHFSDLRISNEVKTIFVGGINGLFKSTDGGLAWKELITLGSENIVGLGISPGYENDSTLAVGRQVWGVYLSNDKGVSWRPKNNGLKECKRIIESAGVSRVFDVVFSPDYPSDSTMFTATWYDFFRSTDSGENWQKTIKNPSRSATHTGFTIAVSPSFASDKTVYFGTRKGDLLKSTDGGERFILVSNLDGAIISIDISPEYSHDQTLFAAVPYGVYKSVDGGTKWKSASEGINLVEKLDLRKEAAIKLAISPNFKIDKTVFAGTAEGVFRTNNGGEYWQKLVNTAYRADGYIEAIALSPDYKNDQTIIVSVRGEGLFKSVDGGETFFQTGHNLIDNNYVFGNMYGFALVAASMPIKFSPSYSVDKTIYGFAESLLFRSTDGGDTWETITLPEPEHELKTYLYLPFFCFTQAIDKYYLRIKDKFK